MSQLCTSVPHQHACVVYNAITENPFVLRHCLEWERGRSYNEEIKVTYHQLG